MGPLIPYGIINENWNYMLALLIGIGFGFVLERAGFSSSRKLVGVFYGYDFVVLRVFFTAAITAMIGLLFMSHFGLIDLSIVYVNPTYIEPAIIGGVIMGIGFVTGGFCPGTSVCAAAIGKIDGIVFVLGSILGIFMYAELYPLLFKGLANAGFIGAPFIYDSLGISSGLFALLLIIIALGAFYITSIIEKRVKKVDY